MLLRTVVSTICNLSRGSLLYVHMLVLLYNYSKVICVKDLRLSNRLRPQQFNMFMNPEYNVILAREQILYCKLTKCSSTEQRLNR